MSADTTFAWLTPPAPAAIGLVRCGAADAHLLDRLLDRAPAPSRARFARLLAPDGRIVDEVVATRLADGGLELSCHGGPGMRAAVSDCLRGHGFVEVVTDGLDGDGAWSDLARAGSPGAVRWLLRHPHALAASEAPTPFARELLFRQPVVLITGPTNAGKSTLLNAWCGRQRALVSDVPGTTRDLIAAEALIAGWRVRLLDSAGLRPSDDALERAGQELVERARAWADAVIHLCPPDQDPSEARSGDLVVLGKADLRAAIAPGMAAWSISGVPGASPAALLATLELRLLAHLGLPPGLVEP